MECPVMSCYSRIMNAPPKMIIDSMKSRWVWGKQENNSIPHCICGSLLTNSIGKQGKYYLNWIGYILFKIQTSPDSESIHLLSGHWFHGIVHK